MARLLRTVAALLLAPIGLGALAVGAVHLGKEGPTARAWARLHPHRALAADAPRVAEVAASPLEALGRPPRNRGELLDALVEAPFTYLRWDGSGDLIDPWGRPMLVKFHHLQPLGVWSVRVYSTGPDGVDDAGFHDDVELDLELSR